MKKLNPIEDGQTRAHLPAPQGLGAALDDHLSPRFTIRDLTVTTSGLPNFPDAEALANLKKLALVLEYVWDRVGPFRIASAYRSDAVQNWIKTGGAGGTAANMAATKSMHSTGEAADIVPTTMSLEQFYVKLFALEDVKKRLGQIVNKTEGGQKSIHLSIPTDRFPAGTPMKVGEDGQYYRLTSDEINKWLEEYPVAIAAGGGFAVLLIGALTFLLVKRLRERRV